MRWKLFVRVLPGIVVAFLLLAGCENPTDGGDAAITDPDLYYSWSSTCFSGGPGTSYMIDMTFGSDGSFSRSQQNWASDDTCAGLADSVTGAIASTFSLHGPTAGDSTIKQLRYLDNSSATVFALYKVTGSTLDIAEDPAGYPADLSGALNMSR